MCPIPYDGFTNLHAQQTPQAIELEPLGFGDVYHSPSLKPEQNLPEELLLFQEINKTLDQFTLVPVPILL